LSVCFKQKTDVFTSAVLPFFIFSFKVFLIYLLFHVIFCLFFDRGPSLISSIEDTSLHISLRQPALGLIYIIIISDASALISYKLKYEAVKKDNVSNSVMFADDDDELPFSHDAEEKSQSCWNDFSVVNKLASRECKDWKCIPLLWYLTMVQLEPSKLPIAFSKAVLWGLSHVSVLEPGLTTESSVPVNAWLSSHAGEVSSTFTWQVPNGADDGGGWRDCINTLKVLQFCTLLLKIFKRLILFSLIYFSSYLVYVLY